MTTQYPFTAITGQPQMKEALILNAINPAIGGVLIRGEKGTAKSTLARALAELLPEIETAEGCPFNCSPDSPMPECPHCSATGEIRPAMRPMPVITLPANATEDRVAGTLDVEYALKHGKRRFEPGVLAAAHRGILYIDEVNLLDDHIVDLLLDAAAMGVNTVEREGLSFTHPARFLLIGTMNPEEGDLRPQLLDRFSLCVDAGALMDIGERTEIVRNRIAWENDPAAFADRFQQQQQNLARDIRAACTLLPRVTISEELIQLAARICIELDVRSHRADIVMTRAALTLAAFDGREQVSEDDIKKAALMSISHRMRRRPFEESRLDPDKIDDALQQPEKNQEQQSENAPDDLQQEAPPDRTFEIGQTPDVTLSATEARPKHASSSGKRTKTTAPGRRGRAARAVEPHGPVSSSDIALDATLRAAAPDQMDCASNDVVHIRPDHIRAKQRTQSAGTTVILAVDASGSMAASERMAAAKGAALALLQDAYVKRNRVALLAFRDDRHEVLLQPTDNVDLAHEHLKELPTGGRTPLAHGLAGGLELAHQIRQRDPDVEIMIALLSDGKANVPYARTETTPFDEAVDFARQLTLAGIRLVVLDAEDDFLSLGLAKKLAEASQAEYVKLSHIEATSIESAVRDRLQD